MSVRSEYVLAYLKKSCSHCYDIETLVDRGALKAICTYYSRDSRYVLTKRAELWAAENYEYLYLWDVERLDLHHLNQIFPAY